MTDAMKIEITTTKEELADLDALISENNRLSGVYPVDDALKLGLHTLKYRRQQLINELKEAGEL